MHTLIDVDEWPVQDLLITAIDVATGEPVVWDRGSGVPLSAAVAASTAFPGAFPAIPINGRHYIDGGLRSPTNADLADGAGTLVLLEPLAHLFPGEPFEQDPTTTVITISPDAPAIAAFGPDLHDVAAWQPSYLAGLHQAAATANRIPTGVL